MNKSGRETFVNKTSQVEKKKNFLIRLFEINVLFSIQKNIFHPIYYYNPFSFRPSLPPPPLASLSPVTLPLKLYRVDFNDKI